MGGVRDHRRKRVVAQPRRWQRTAATNVSARGGCAAILVTGRKPDRIPLVRSWKTVENFSDLRARGEVRRIVTGRYRGTRRDLVARWFSTGFRPCCFL